MKRRDWWWGIGLVAAALVFHAVFPRWEYRVTDIGDVPVGVRCDRWTGKMYFSLQVPAKASWSFGGDIE